MGESSACLMRSFSQPSSSFHESTEGDPIRALTSSISFGRYMSESLAWEKWSAFTHNRYMEEVEKYSRPGSVAQMKAHFEAHFKKKAAERAAALLEQKTTANSTSELKMRTEKENNSPMNRDLAPKDNHVVTKETQRVEVQKHDKGRELVVEVEEAEQAILVENQVELPNQLESVEDAGKVMSNEGNKTHVKGVATSGVSASSDKNKSAFSSTKSTGYNGVPKPPAPPKPTISLLNRMNTNASPGCKKTSTDSTNRQRATYDNGVPKAPAPPKPTISLSNRSNINANPACKKTSTDLINRQRAAYDKGVPRAPAPPKPTISLSNKSNINASPASKKTTTDSTNRKRATSSSLHMSINFSSRETKKPLSPILQKITNSRLVKTLANAAKERTTQQTPISASIDNSTRPAGTPQRGNNRPRILLNQSMCESGKVERKSLSPRIGGLKSPSVGGRRAQSPVISYSFTFKSEERAAKRKEFFERLEQKSKAKETEKEQLQAKLKVPIPPIRPCSPKLARRTTPLQSQDINSRPPWRLTAKTDGSKETRGKNNRTPAYSSKKSVHENASPNIQI